MSRAVPLAASRAPDALTIGLICLSAACLIIGAAFPVGAKLANPFLAYGIVSVSWPAWGIGAFAGGTVVWRSSRRQPPEPTCFWLGLVLLFGNVLAALLVLVIPFHAS